MLMNEELKAEWEIINPFEDTDRFDILYNSRYTEIKNILESHVAIKATYGTNQYFIYSPSAKQTGFKQITYFWKDIPQCDVARDNIDEIIQEIIHTRFDIVEAIPV